MNYSKNDVLRVLGMKASREIRIDADAELLKKIEYVHYVMFKNEITPRIMRTLVFNFGLLCVTELVDKQQIKSVFHLLKIYKTIVNTLKDYVEVSQEQQPFVQMTTIRKIVNELKIRAYDYEKERAFFDYIEQFHKEVIGDKVIIDSESVKRLFVAFETSRIKAGKI